jgi:hypothetical protein
VKPLESYVDVFDNLSSPKCPLLALSMQLHIDYCANDTPILADANQRF